VGLVQLVLKVQWVHPELMEIPEVMEILDHLELEE
jgi:hypothetical protein